MQRTLNTTINSTKIGDAKYSISRIGCNGFGNITIQDACGIGGLLYLKRNGVIYIPFYDAYGNLLGYTDAQGNVVAEYSYNALGGLGG